MTSITQPGRLCSAPSCTHLLPCPIHQRADYTYGARHKRWRRQVIDRAEGRCIVSGCESPAVIADHIKPISQGGSALDLDNGQAMCWAHHSSKTRSDGGRGFASPPTQHTDTGTDGIVIA